MFVQVNIHLVHKTGAQLQLGSQRGGGKQRF
jgi:hypothetical protein